MDFVTKDKFLKNVTFVKSVAELDQLPQQDLKEICIIGRSNVGKSSLINMLCNQNNMAKTSKEAGCTRLINFFNVNNSFYLVDLPGYGYAKAGKKLVKGWNNLIITFLKGSKRLMRVYLLIDSRHGFKDNDIEVMSLMDEIGLSYQIVFTKIDKINKEELANVKEKFFAILKNHPAMLHEFICSSSLHKFGVEDFLQSLEYMLK